MGKLTWKSVRPVKIIGCDAVILLADGTYAIVDSSDFQLVRHWNWSASDGSVVSGTGSLHHLVMGCSRSVLIDHIDGDVRNNRKSNLRFATKAQNARNRRIASNNTSGFKGVSPRRDRGTWLAHITAHGRRIKIGTFRTPEEAAKAYDQRARELHGEFACLNFPKGEERSALAKHAGAAA